jgi:tetratricopeptide (TPR) repeat protein
VSEPPKKARPLRLFISYAHEDEEQLRELERHLSQLRREGCIEDWHDRHLTGGTEWRGRIDAELKKADIVLLLVSPAFVHSDYCNDVELARAMVRHKKGLARVIPVILRPVDWETASFGTLQALPTNGKSIVQWEPVDSGYLDVAKGVRRVVEELRKDGDEGGVRWRWGIVVATLALSLLLGWAIRQWIEQHGELSQDLALARGFLDTGHYADAAAAFAQALEVDPGSPEAALGREKAVLGMEPLAPKEFDSEGFGRRLDGLLARAPDDPDLILLDGDRHYRRGELTRAEARYRDALARRPDFPEALFRLGVLRSQAGDMEGAQAQYRAASELAPDTAHYRSNLAQTYLAQGDYRRAVEEFARVERFPLAAVESAYAHWALGELGAAAGDQQRALRWLEDPQVQSLPANRRPWEFSAGSEGVRLLELAEKRCLAGLGLAATRFLLQDPEASGDAIRSAACPPDASDVRAAVSAALASYAEPRQELAAASRAFRERHLSARR